MRNVIILGSGGHAAEIDDYINFYNTASQSEKLYILGYLDDDPKSYENYDFSAPYLGTIKDHVVRLDASYIMAIANIKYRKPIIQVLLNQYADFFTFIHPSSFVSKSAIIDKGSVIAPNVNIGPNVKIGKFNMINARASIGHDTVIGDYNFITPNVCFSGYSKVGNENMFGINSATIPNISIGSNNTIAAGMVIDKNVKDNSTVFYRFKEKVMIIRETEKK